MYSLNVFCPDLSLFVRSPAGVQPEKQQQQKLGQMLFIFNTVQFQFDNQLLNTYKFCICESLQN